MEEVLSVRELVRVYGKGVGATRALDGVSLSLRAGEYAAVMGPSGSGKSTLRNCVSTIDRPTAGSIVIDRQELTGEFCRSCGYCLPCAAGIDIPQAARLRAQLGSAVYGADVTSLEEVVLPLLKTDLLTIFQAVRDGRLAEVPVEFSDGAAACVILASGGYPGHYEKGKAITLPGSLPENVTVYHAGDALTAEGALVTAGGRALGVTATAATLEEALRDAYAAADAIDFDGKYLRRYIVRRALAVKN